MRRGEAFKTVRTVGERILEPRYAIVFLTFLASAIRLLPMRFRYLLGYDPYFHLAYIRYALSHGWVNFFPYARGPWGYQLRFFHPKGLWMTPAYVYKFLSHFGVSLFNAFRITPVIFGVLTVIFLYLSILRLYGRKKAFLTAFLLAVSFGHVFRSMAGYYRGDNYMLFWYSVALLGIALGLTWKPKKWKYEGFLFYLVPAIAMGLSAIFWQAYYPIFAFVLANGVLLSAGAFLLGKDEKIIDGIFVVLSTALGALIANSLGGIFGYGMVGADKRLGIKFAKEFHLHFGFMKDAFLLLFLKYAVPLAVLIGAILLVLSKGIRDKKARTAVVGIALVVSLWVFFFRYYGMVDKVLNMLFPQAPITETQRTSFSAWWEAYGIAGLFVPFFVLRFLRKPKVGDFLFLGTVVVILPMALIWTRFLFVGSFAVAVMPGIGLIELSSLIRRVGRKPKWRVVASTIVTILLLGVPAVTAYQGFERTLSVKPFMNSYWEKALTYLGEHSNINDVVLTWWDQGHWVTYYAMRAPVAQGGPNMWVARYYLGLVNEKGLMNLGVDYVIVSYDTVLKFGAVLRTAGASSEGYALVPLYRVPSAGNVLIFSNGPYAVYATPGEKWSVKVNLGGTVVTPVNVFVEAGNTIGRVPLEGKPTGNVYVYINLNYGYAVIMNRKAFDTPLARLMFTDNYSSNYRLLYSDGGIIKIFRFVHPNVIVTAENGSVVLKFENATGTGLGIYGYLDNGTLVFKKWYSVKDREEFILPQNLNGSVVVRYTYTGGRTVLDRGVFRIEDVLTG